MIHQDKLPEEILAILNAQSATELDRFEVPPPCFLAMQGEFVVVNLEENFFRCRFPVLPEQLNPFGYMQGGMVSAAIDNTIGPLSMLVAPPNVTLKMEVSYLQAISREVKHIYVTAMFIKQRKKILHFEAVVTDAADDITFATAKATHYVVNSIKDN
ncbi:MAG: PaaI family thioesterase [Desulfocapsaceae bacterium]|nr:PaaI family thioesterase [Desulfocapsaceae bacterium]